MRCLIVSLAIVSVLHGLPAAFAAEDDATAEDFLRYFKPLIGEWRETIAVEGEPASECRWSCKLSPTGRCFVTTRSDTNGKPFLQTVEGYDPESKGWKIVCFFANGDHAIITIRAQGEDIRRPGKQVTVKQETRLVRSDGAVMSEKRTAVYTDLGQDKWECLMKEHTTESGDKVPAAKVTFERVKK